MRYFIIILLLLIPVRVFAQNAASIQNETAIPHTLIKSISIEGFVLQDKDQFIKLFKPFRNKYLTTSDMDAILHKIQDIYEQEGYQELVSITYKVTKHRLVYNALMTN